MHEHTNGTSGVHQLTKNNYFYGKLLTVEDMATEQAYHAGVERTLSRFVTGWGGVCGLDVSAAVVTDDGGDVLAVTVSEGLALDRCGRLVVIDDEQRLTLPIPVTAGGEPTDTVAVYVEYDECYTDPVPAAKMENACEEECKDNRIVEGAEVTLEPGDPGDYHKSIAEIEFPDAEGLGRGDEPAGTLAVRGDVEVESGEEGPERGTIEMTVSDDAPSGTVVVDVDPLYTGEADRLTATVRVPPDALIGPEGFVPPEGQFDVQGTLRTDRAEADVGGTLTATPGDGVIEFGGTLVLETPDDQLQADVDATIDIGDGSLGIDGDIGFGEATFGAQGELEVADRDDQYLLTGGVTVRQRRRRESMFEGTIETVEWRDGGETVPGFLVDKPVTADAPGEVVDLDAVLSGLARSYYENEPRTECGGVDDDPVLIGTITARTDDWTNTAFERGPLVATNDMLFDILARHVADFDNPHDVSLGVGSDSDGGGGGSDARIGVEESGGLSGSVALTSTDDSVTITPDRRHDRVDLAAGGGLAADFEEYYVFEKSLWNKVEAYTDLVRDAPRYQVPQEVREVAFRIVHLATLGLNERVYESADPYVKYLQTERPPEDNPFLEEYGSVNSILQLEKKVIGLLDIYPDTPVSVRLSKRALGTLSDLVEEYNSTGGGAVDVAMAEDRVAEAAGTLLRNAPTVERGEETGGPAGIIGRAAVPDVSDQASEYSVRELWESGWVYRIEPAGVDVDETDELPDGRVNETVKQQPDAETIHTKPKTVTLQVVAPPPADRVDGIGPNYAAGLANAGIDTVSELSLIEPHAFELLTTAGRAQAEELVDKGRGYAATYSLTRFDGIGSAQAEAFYEALGWTDYWSLQEANRQELIERLDRDVEEGQLKPKYRDLIENIDWDSLQRSIKNLTS